MSCVQQVTKLGFHPTWLSPELMLSAASLSITLIIQANVCTFLSLNGPIYLSLETFNEVFYVLFILSPIWFVFN